MNVTRNLERALADHLANEGLLRSPDRVLISALATIEVTPQRRLLRRVPSRLLDMNRYLQAAAAAVVVIGVLALGWALYAGRGPSIGGNPTASPSPTGPTGSPGPALTERFTSTVHGITVGYPAGWTVQPATEQWTDRRVMQESAFADVIYEKDGDTPFIALASEPLDGKPLDRWSSDYLGASSCVGPQQLTIDGASGLLEQCDEGLYGFVASEGRGYLIWLYRIDNLEWFEQILGTVQLNPQDAVAPSPSD